MADPFLAGFLVGCGAGVLAAVIFILWDSLSF